MDCWGNSSLERREVVPCGGQGRPIVGIDEIMYIDLPAQDPILNKCSINFSDNVEESRESGGR